MAHVTRDPLMRYALKGRVATMNAAFTVFPTGAVYVDGQSIGAVQDSAAPPPPDLAGAATVSTTGIIFPGLIELHNHLSYNALTMWAVPRKFADRGRWQDNADYKRRGAGSRALAGPGITLAAGPRRAAPDRLCAPPKIAARRRADGSGRRSRQDTRRHSPSSRCIWIR